MSYNHNPQHPKYFVDTGPTYDQSFDGIVLPPTMNENPRAYLQYAHYKQTNKPVEVLKRVPSISSVREYREYSVYWSCVGHVNNYALYYSAGDNQMVRIKPVDIESGIIIWSRDHR